MKFLANAVYEFSVAISHLSHVCMCMLSCGLPFPTPADFPNPKDRAHLLHLLHWQMDSLPSEPPGKPQFIGCDFIKDNLTCYF